MIAKNVVYILREMILQIKNGKIYFTFFKYLFKNFSSKCFEEHVNIFQNTLRDFLIFTNIARRYEK